MYYIALAVGDSNYKGCYSRISMGTRTRAAHALYTYDLSYSLVAKKLGGYAYLPIRKLPSQ